VTEREPEDVIREYADKIVQPHEIIVIAQQILIGEGHAQAIKERVDREQCDDGQTRGQEQQPFMSFFHKLVIQMSVE
jgi:hypothetical protein